MKKTFLLFVLLGLGMKAPAEGEHRPPFAIPSNGVGAICPCAFEAPEMLPAEYREYLDTLGAKVLVSGDKNLTLQPVNINPLGADPNSPWYIHLASLNVRNLPTVSGSSVIGSLPRNSLVTGVYNIVVESDEEWLQINFNGQTGHISRLGFSRVHPFNQNLIDIHGNLPYGREIVNRWWGIPLEYEPNDLITIPAPYNSGISGRVYQLRREAGESVMEMIDAARAEGVFFYVSSPYRSGAAQQTIYVDNTQRDLSQRSSAPPGHSEHQLGATVDFSNGLPGRFLRNTDPQHAWLAANGATYGWRQTYTADNVDETGYIEEPWHWRYVGFAEDAPDGWVLR